MARNRRRSRPSRRAYPHELERDVICADGLEVVCLRCPPNDYYPCDDTGAHESVILEPRQIDTVSPPVDAASPGRAKRLRLSRIPAGKFDDATPALMECWCH